MEQRALATLVEPLEAQIASQQIASPQIAERQRNERVFPVLLVSALAIFAFAVAGYHPFAEDGGLYAAGVERLLDPSLFPHETAFVLAPMRHSLFAPAS